MVTVVVLLIFVSPIDEYAKHCTLSNREQTPRFISARPDRCCPESLISAFANLVSVQ